MCTNRLQNSIATQRREIAAFLQEGREEGARLKAEHVLRQARMERALEILITLCELLISRMTYLATEKTCPPDLVSPLQSLLYCEPRLNIEELAGVRRQFALKFGEAFVQAGLKNAKHEVHFKEPAGTVYDFVPWGSERRLSRRESMHARGEYGAACGESSGSPTSEQTRLHSSAPNSNRSCLHAATAAAVAAVEAREAQVESPCCFPSLRAPASHSQASPSSALWHEEGQRASPETRLHALALTAEERSRTPRQADGCETPFHQEIHVGLSPPRLSCSSSSTTSRFAADKRIALSCCSDTPAGAKWERDASPRWTDNTAASSRCNSPSPHGQHDAAATAKAAAAAAAAAAAGRSYSVGVPAAAVPAYSLHNQQQAAAAAAALSAAAAAAAALRQSGRKE
ncbi:hypothetical protein ACSSS7_005741 [Eimeria intestinalis]